MEWLNNNFVIKDQQIVVPTSASGAQGEKPLLKQEKVREGSRQNSFESSREEVALVIRKREFMGGEQKMKVKSDQKKF